MEKDSDQLLHNKRQAPDSDEKDSRSHSVYIHNITIPF